MKAIAIEQLLLLLPLPLLLPMRTHRQVQRAPMLSQDSVRVYEAGGTAESSAGVDSDDNAGDAGGIAARTITPKDSSRIDGTVSVVKGLHRQHTSK
jgi:hypothetical protein